jgi:hypothetical protein
MSKLTKFEQLGELYKDTRGVRALVQLVPNVGGAIDALIVDNLDRIKAERARTFFDELAKGDTVLTPELIQTDDFLHAYFATARAAFNTKQHEKIRWFAQLLLSGTDNKSSLNLGDEYEDLLSVLDELSYRELSILAILLEFENQNEKSADETEPQWTTKFWTQFGEEVFTRFQIPLSELDYVMTRIGRTATFISYRAYGALYIGDLGGRGRSTPIFHKLTQHIKLETSRLKP